MERIWAKFEEALKEKGLSFENLKGGVESADDLKKLLTQKLGIDDLLEIAVITAEFRRRGGFEGISAPKYRDKKRLREEDSYYHPTARQKVTNMKWLDDFPAVLEENQDRTYYYFGIRTFIPPLRQWMMQIAEVPSRSQQKSLLFVDGAVKSGKTTFVRYLAPFILRAENLIQEEDFCFVYLDLSALAGKNSPEKKWKTLFHLFQQQFGDIWVDCVPDISDYSIKVRAALRGLKEYREVRRWVIALDEYHFIFNQLDTPAMEDIAETMKLVLLDNDSPCHFMLAGSTQATFWWSIHKARPNGLNFMAGAVILTTPFISNNQELDLCKQVLNQKENIGMQDLETILDLLALRNVVNLTQTSLILKYSGVQTPKGAYERLVENKMEVYWRDYHAVPEGITPEVFMDWANGSKASLPNQLQHLLEKRGNLYFLKDPNFEAFLKQYYNPVTHMLERIQGAIPWGDVLLFIPLLPLGQNQKDQNIDENKFENLCQTNLKPQFNHQAGWDRFAKYLTHHAANPTYALMQPNQVTWVLVMRLLCNIVAHEKNLQWFGLTACLAEVLLYTNTHRNFRELIFTYEQCLL